MINPGFVIPAQAGIQCLKKLDTGLRRCDELDQKFFIGLIFQITKRQHP